MEGLFEFGYWGLLLGSFLAATVLPFSSEALLILMISHGGYNIYNIITIATIGNWLGGMSCYYLGFLGNWKLAEKYLKIKEEKILKLKKWLDKYGSMMAWLCWLPIVGDPLALGLGFIRSNVFLVSIYMFFGKLLRYITIAYITQLGLS